MSMAHESFGWRRSRKAGGMDDPEKLEFLTRMMQRSVDNVKRLVETEIDSGEA